jgi:uncharacterized protein
VRYLSVIGQAVIVWLLQLTFCHATSFDCRPYLARQACPELLICSEPTLSSLDETMASLYQEARSSLPAEAVTAFRDYQREWLARRGTCGCNYSCLADEYRSQIDGLRKTLREMNQ